MPERVNSNFPFSMLVGRRFRCSDPAANGEGEPAFFEVIPEDEETAIPGIENQSGFSPPNWIVACPNCRGGHRFGPLGIQDQGHLRIGDLNRLEQLRGRNPLSELEGFA